MGEITHLIFFFFFLGGEGKIYIITGFPLFFFF